MSDFIVSNSDRPAFTAQQFLDEALAAATQRCRLPTEAQMTEMLFKFGDFQAGQDVRYFTTAALVKAWRQSREAALNKPCFMPDDLRDRLIRAWECRATRVTQ